ncbi:MAG TPA: bifunctional DNA primase/polymerase [Pirellulaceae bacterium]|nr:bifunctional DNA primase/polymerase [Pirellulaceae bacterium]
MSRKSQLLPVAESYAKAGLSVIPIKPDGTKAPAVAKWKPYQRRRATGKELRAWFGQSAKSPNGIAVVCGSVSGNLEVVDVDAPELGPSLMAAIKSQSRGLVKRLSQVATPSGGLHLYYRCKTIEGNQKLAMRAADSNGRTGKKTLIETRGEGGYVVAPGSPANCHSLGKPYKHVAGPPLCKLTMLTEAEREIVLDAARSLNEAIEPAQANGQGPPGASNRPGDRFNRQADWGSILEPRGWTKAAESNGEIRWRRPGKSQGWSATTGHCSNGQSGDLLYVFSGNAAPFEAGRAYNKFAAHALLNHNGDFCEAAGELDGQQGQRRTANLLVELASDVELFHTPKREAFATFPVNGHVETAPVRSRPFRHWLAHRFYQRERRTANQQAMNEALDAIEGRAQFDGAEIPVHTRLAASGGKVFLDLGDEHWSNVEISAEGWKILASSPVKFRRTPGMQPLPIPVVGGNIDELRRYVNVCETDWRILRLRLIGNVTFVDDLVASRGRFGELRPERLFLNFPAGERAVELPVSGIGQIKSVHQVFHGFLKMGNSAGREAVGQGTFSTDFASHVRHDDSDSVVAIGDELSCRLD